MTNGNNAESTTTAAASSGVVDALSINQQLELIYIAYFNRAADNAGFTFWSQQNAEAQGGGQSAELALTNIANSFAPQNETVALYSFLAPIVSGGTIDLTTPAAQAGLTAFINGVYQNMFGRAADTGGLAYWTGQITSGAVGLGAAALAIANGATGSDAIEIQNKVAVALDFTSRTGSSGDGITVPLPASFLSAARSVLGRVDGIALNDDSVAQGQLATTQYLLDSLTFLTINGTRTDQTTTDTTPIAPFAAVTIADTAVNQTETVVVTLSNPANGTLSNLDGGTYDATTGTYTLTGSPSAVTQGLDQVTFVPTAHQAAGGESITTTFTIAVNDTKGSSAVNVASVTATETSTDGVTVPPDPFPVFSTGVDNTGQALALGAIDSHYTLVGTPSGVASTDVLANGFAPSQWIGPTANPGTGTIDYRTTFDLTGLNPATAILQGDWAAESAATMQLNGTVVGTELAGKSTAFSITTGFTAGVNTLDFIVSNTAATGDAIEVAFTQAAATPNSGSSMLASDTHGMMAATAGWTGATNGGF